MSGDKGQRGRTDVTDRKRESTVSRKDGRQRIPIREQNALSCEKEPGFTYRWVNDTPGRIARMLRAGWEFVEDDIQTTFSGASTLENQRGSQVWRVVNQGIDAPCREAALMRIPTELFDEDQAALQAKVDEKEKSIDPTGLMKKANQFGSMTRTRS